MKKMDWKAVGLAVVLLALGLVSLAPELSDALSSLGGGGTSLRVSVVEVDGVEYEAYINDQPVGDDTVIYTSESRVKLSVKILSGRDRVGCCFALITCKEPVYLKMVTFNDTLTEIHEEGYPYDFSEYRDLPWPDANREYTVTFGVYVLSEPKPPPEPEYRPVDVEIVGYTATPDGWVALSGCIRYGEDPVYVTVDWGDGSKVTCLREDVRLVHSYAVKGRYRIVVEAVDARGSRDSDSITVTSHTLHYSSILELLGIPQYRQVAGVLLIVIGGLLLAVKVKEVM